MTESPNHTWSLIFDFFELTSFCLLSVEAIKLENIRKLSRQLLSSYRSLNPKLQYVDELQTDLPFRERYWFALFTSLMIFFGQAILAAAWMKFKVSWLHPGLWWPAFVVLDLLAAFLVGAAVYIGLVKFTKSIIELLWWIQRKTATGTVGILGFFCFLVQFFGRRLLS